MNRPVALGLRENLPQFSLLLVINAFVGIMVGMERSILPLLAGDLFGIASRSAMLSFLVSFGLAKAVSNIAAGRLSDRIGRKQVLVAGWIVGLPVPLLLMLAPSWSWVVAANALLGVNQGLCWSAAVIMKVDLAGPRRRGLATGLNEFSGYLAVAGAAYATAAIAASYGLHPYPFLVGVLASICGLVLSLFFARDTRSHVDHEVRTAGEPGAQQVTEDGAGAPRVGANLFSCNQAGFINNLNDAIAWGVFPVHLALLGFSLGDRGMLAGLYPATWGVMQLLTGALSDRWGRKWFIAGGLWLQSIAIALVAIGTSLLTQAVAAALLGIGTAMVYPVLLSSVGDSVQPRRRAAALGGYRFWRDIGYAAGALLAGLLADTWGLSASIIIIAIMTWCSGMLFAVRYHEAREIRPG